MTNTQMGKELKIRKYHWPINPNEMPMDELKALKEHLDDVFEIREQDKSFWLNRMYQLIDDAKAAGFQFTYADANFWINLTVNRNKFDIEIKEEWV